MVMYVLLTDQVIWREGLRCVLMVLGELCVMTTGHKRMQMSSAGNLDTLTQVSSCNVTFCSYIHPFSLF